MLHVRQWCKLFPSDSSSQDKSKESRTGVFSGHKKSFGRNRDPNKTNSDRKQQDRYKNKSKSRRSVSPHRDHNNLAKPNELRERSRSESRPGPHPLTLPTPAHPDTESMLDAYLRTQHWVQQCAAQDFSEDLKERERVAKDEKGVEKPCRVCQADRPDHAFYPCGHLCLCANCKPDFQSKFKHCPVCNQIFFDIIRIYKL